MEAIIFHERLSGFKEIEKLLVESQVLLNPYAIESDATYKLEHYLLNNEQKVSYLLDRNIVSYLIDLVKGIELELGFERSRCHRITAGLQAFFITADITSEPGLSYHEYIENSSIEQADKELSLFRSADNLDRNIYLDIALSRTHSVPFESVTSFSSGELLGLEPEQRLRAFEFSIVVIKKGLSIRSRCDNDYEAMKQLLEWMFEDYVVCTPALYFMAIYFSGQRVPKMLKSSSIRSVRNAAWDLALLQHWMSLFSKDQEQVWLLASMDKAIIKTANLMLMRSSESNDDYLKRLEQTFSSMWGKKFGYGRGLFQRLCFWLDNVDSHQRKANNPKNRTSEYMLAIRASVHEEYVSSQVV
ncbi:TPA: hypothetical protein KD882_004344 [Vibrio parahaemolyticus]|nr:hypothetical protein [Vibrio parahaemolyticus]HBC3883331.1 hypothetical protein [Vibrio parahaemolyticus]HBC3907639.1 hypothetical protein [Vibrio parahaemolyticus]